MGSEFEINTESKAIESQRDFQIAKANDKYLITSFSNYIDIFNLKNLEIKYMNSISLDESQIITNMDFNPNFPEIILSSFSDGNINLWKINDDSDNNSYKEICTIKAHETNVKNSLFNPVYGNLIISSDNKNIRLWDITKYIYSYNILTQGKTSDLQWDTTGKYYGYINNNSELIIRELNNYQTTISIKDNLNKFLFKSDNEILTFSEKAIKSWDFRNTKKALNSKIFHLPRKSRILYNINCAHLYYIQFNSCEIFDINKFDFIYSKRDKNIIGKNLILLNDSFLKGKEISNILDILFDNQTIIKVIQKTEKKNSISPIKQADKDDNDKYKNYLDNIIHMISDFNSLFKFEENNKREIIFIKKKKYFMIPEIERELEKLKVDTIFKRKEYVREEISKKKEFNNIKEQYLYYLKLLIRDNTNRLLIKEYLQFLKTKENEIKNNFDNFEEYKNEILFYKACLSQKELKELGENKKLSEKEDLINFLQELRDIENITNNISEVYTIRFKRLKNIDEVSFFNQPIDLDNEELFYYKCKNILYFDFMTKNDYSRDINKFILIQNLIREILDRNIFENIEIIKNKDKLNLIIYLITEPQSDDANVFLLNFLVSNKLNINEIPSDLNFKKGLINEESAFVLGNTVFYNDDLKNLCKDNIVRFFKNEKINKNLYNIEDFYTFDFKLNEINSNSYINDIKTFLKIILKKNVFKEVFKLLYGNDYLDFFNNEKFLSEIIDNHLKFIPFKSNNNCGMTDRFTLDSYIFFENKPITYGDIIINDNDRQLVEEALKIGKVIVIIFHELNHNIYSYLLYFFNNINYSFQTPRKSKISEFREGGFYIENLLFGRIIESLNLEEALYIMNIDNYNMDLNKFQKGFTTLKGKSNINGVFSKFNAINKFSYYSSINGSLIKTKNTIKNSSMKNITIDIKIGSKCVSGINRDNNIKASNQFYKNHH